MIKTDPTQARQPSSKPQPNTLPIITRVRLPQRLRDDGWWLCPAPEVQPDTKSAPPNSG